MIGVFDSGSGGLTVYQKLVLLMPTRAFAYFGDHAHCPYGLRPHAEVLELTRKACTFLFEQGCRIVVLACNTATAVALKELQQDWLPHSAYAGRRVLGIIAPTVEAITGMPWGSTEVKQGGQECGPIAFFATHRTVQSGVYETELKKRTPHVEVIAQECLSLAGAIEEGAPCPEIEAYVQHAVAEVMKKAGGRPLHQAVLGCTHYGLVEDVFRRALPAGTALLSQGQIVAAALQDYLQRHPALDEGGQGQRLFFTTGNAERARETARALLGEALPYQAIPAPAA